MKDNGIYTLSELAGISVKAQQVAKLADQMSTMTIFGNEVTRKAHSQRMQDELQAAFSDLCSDVLGLIEDSEESAPEADLGGQSKLNARDLACFEQVASALGEVQAESELQQVIDSGLKVDESNSLFNAFIWEKSPQGYYYWRGVLSNEERK